MTDFWGVALPAWVGAAGSIAASAIATIALVREVRTRGGLRQATAPQRADAPPVASVTRPRTLDEREDASSAHDGPTWDGEDTEQSARGEVLHPRRDDLISVPAFEPPDALQVVYVDRKRLELVNRSRGIVRLLEVRQVNNGVDVRHHTHLPIDLRPGEFLRLEIHRSLATPTVIALDVTYGGSGWSRRQRFFLD